MANGIYTALFFKPARNRVPILLAFYAIQVGSAQSAPIAPKRDPLLNQCVPVLSLEMRGSVVHSERRNLFSSHSGANLAIVPPHLQTHPFS